MRTAFRRCHHPALSPVGKHRPLLCIAKARTTTRRCSHRPLPNRDEVSQPASTPLTNRYVGPECRNKIRPGTTPQDNCCRSRPLFQKKATPARNRPATTARRLANRVVRLRPVYFFVFQRQER